MAKLYFYYASMNAGKSTTLLQADFNYRERGMNTMLFTAAVDDRFAAGTITSRIGLKAPATPFDVTTDLAACVADRQQPPGRLGPQQQRAAKRRDERAEPRNPDEDRTEPAPRGRD